MSTVKKRVAELEGAHLDWAVAKALGLVPDDEYWAFIDGIPQVSWFTSGGEFGGTIPLTGWMNPSTKWEHGGPIIERNGIWLAAPRRSRTEWSATVGDSTDDFRGPTPLVAAMRAFVASKLGDEVEVPE